MSAMAKGLVKCAADVMQAGSKYSSGMKCVFANDSGHWHIIRGLKDPGMIKPGVKGHSQLAVHDC